MILLLMACLPGFLRPTAPTPDSPPSPTGTPATSVPSPQPGTEPPPTWVPPTWDPPPPNAWVSSSPPAGTQGQGFEVGEVVPDLTFPDQNGDDVALWQFHGRTLVLIGTTMWVAPGQELAMGLAAPQPTWDPATTVFTVVYENVDSNPPSTEDLALWDDTFGVDDPVVSDPTGVLDGLVVDGQHPYALIVGPDLVVVERVSSPAVAAVVAAVEDAQE